MSYQSIATIAFAAMCGSPQSACQQRQVESQSQEEQGFLRSCRTSLKPIEKDYEHGLHIRKLRLGPARRYRIRSPRFGDENSRYTKLVSRRFNSPLYSSRIVPNALIAVQGENCTYWTRQKDEFVKCILRSKRNSSTDRTSFVRSVGAQPHTDRRFAKCGDEPYPLQIVLDYEPRAATLRRGRTRSAVGRI